MARVLVIDDNPDNLDLMVYLLNAFGHVAMQAANAVDGLAAARQTPPDVILCDLNMPGVDGYEAAGRIKRDPLLAGLPLVAVTAYAMVGDRDKVLAAGFDGYITKPIVPETFVSQVEHYLAPGGHTAPTGKSDRGHHPHR